MCHSKFRRIAATGALALIAAIPLAACGGPAVSPRPAEAATPRTPTAPPSASAEAVSPAVTTTRPAAPPKTRTVEPGRTTTRPKPTSTRSTGSCLGAVRYDLDLNNTVLDLVKSMCFHTGGVLRLQGTGPGLVTATPESLRSKSYEGGVEDIRFLRPGTVTVTIPRDEQTYTIEVVVIS
ncbi:hypothetical protein [Paractinoplanes toevensis]|uniref:Uncharacterized protein n=1 Tax=Paractinoplanes toevensis TaxID=571911 RepID=A0A919W2M9_9ACTN|nr:hypothetical protein [Actinoplanes toevensis]GIM89675.1 hypothetical protein Ato02nite_014680 [Actinoplanes toevensis]